MNLIKLTPNDDFKVFNLVRSTMGEEIGNHCRESLIDAQDTCERILYGYFMETELKAVCGIYNGFYDTKKAYISWFTVSNTLQRSGIGSNMMEFIEQQAIQDKIEWLYVETYDNELFRKANGFYRKHGFTFAGVLLGYLEDGTNAIYYRKKLGL